MTSRIILTVASLFFYLLSTSHVYAEDVEEELTPEEIAHNKAIYDCIHILEETGLIDANDRLVKRYCETKVASNNRYIGRFGKRIMAERATELNPYVITPHEMSYIMPFVVTDNFNTTPYEVYEVSDENGETRRISDDMSNFEAKYQISFKVPLRTSSLFIKGDGIYFAMTLQAWWQIYSDEISKPFRETNYKPEIFYIAPLPFKFDNANMGFAVNFEHQSNGQFQGLSRSWNRIHYSLIFDSDNFSGGIKMWHRIEEQAKENEFDPTGDDNPDIDDYYGNYEVKLGYAFNDHHKLYTSIRKNWQTGNGSIELNYTFPFLDRLRGFAQYFSGYGESLIDYNHKQQKLGFGIALTDIF